MKLYTILVSAVLLWSCSDDPLQESMVLGPSGEPSVEELGLRLVPEGVELNTEGLSSEQIALVPRGAYIVNGSGGCIGCHSSEAGHLAGGDEFPSFFGPDAAGSATVVARNLTPHPEHGMLLTEEQFIEAMRTGKDFHDSERSTSGLDERMLFMTTAAYRFLTDEDLRAMYAYLRAVPAVDHEVRREYVPPIPAFPPVPAPPLPAASASERGLLVTQLLAGGEDGERFAEQFAANIADFSESERGQVGRGSYLVNVVAICGTCHTDGTPDGFYDAGLLPQSFDVNMQTYLAGGVDIGVFSGQMGLYSRNLTPHPDTGLETDKEEFVQVMRFGADFRRSGASLRVTPHFPAEFRMTLEDVEAIYSYLRAIPAIDNDVEITP